MSPRSGRRARPVIFHWNEACSDGGVVIDDLRAVRDDPACVWIVSDGVRIGLIDRVSGERHGVCVGTVLDAETAGRIDAEVRERLCDRSAVRMLAARSHTAAMLGRKLVMRGHDRVTAARVCERWRERGAIDDARFAETAVRNELARRPAGRRLLESKLAAKGVGRAAADAAIDAALSGRDELSDAIEFARRSVGSIARSLRGQGDRGDVVRRRAFGRLARRGFSGDTSRRAIDIAMREIEA